MEKDDELKSIDDDKLEQISGGKVEIPINCGIFGNSGNGGDGGAGVMGGSGGAGGNAGSAG